MQNRSYPLERILQCLRIDFDKLLVDASHNVIQFEEYKLPHLNEWKIQLTVVLRFSIMLKKHFTQKLQFCHHLLTLVSFPTIFELLWYTNLLLIFWIKFYFSVFTLSLCIVLVLLLCFVNVIIIYICVHIVFYRFLFICFSLLSYFSTSI